jgi:hypothetical protein
MIDIFRVSRDGVEGDRRLESAFRYLVSDYVGPHLDDDLSPRQAVGMEWPVIAGVSVQLLDEPLPAAAAERYFAGTPRKFALIGGLVTGPDTGAALQLIVHPRGNTPRRVRFGHEAGLVDTERSALGEVYVCASLTALAYWAMLNEQPGSFVAYLVERAELHLRNADAVDALAEPRRVLSAELQVLYQEEQGYVSVSKVRGERIQ